MHSLLLKKYILGSLFLYLRMKEIYHPSCNYFFRTATGISLAFPFSKSIIILYTSTGLLSSRNIELGTEFDLKCANNSRGWIPDKSSERTFSFSLLATEVKYSLNLFAFLRLRVIIQPSMTKLSLNLTLIFPRISFITSQFFLSLMHAQNLFA